MKYFPELTFFCLIACCTSISAVSREEVVERIQMIVEECKKEVGAKPVDIQELLNNKAPSSMVGKCLRACVMKKFQVMDSNGKFVATAAMNEARKLVNGDAYKMHIAQNLTNTCNDIQVSVDHCEAAADYGNCFRQQIKLFKFPEH